MTTRPIGDNIDVENSQLHLRFEDLSYRPVSLAAQFQGLDTMFVLIGMREGFNQQRASALADGVAIARVSLSSPLEVILQAEALTVATGGLVSGVYLIFDRVVRTVERYHQGIANISEAKARTSQARYDQARLDLARRELEPPQPGIHGKPSARDITWDLQTTGRRGQRTSRRVNLDQGARTLMALDKAYLESD